LIQAVDEFISMMSIWNDTE